MAGGVMAFVNCPVELLKVKLQTQYTPAPGAAPIAGALKPVSLCLYFGFGRHCSLNLPLTCLLVCLSVVHWSFGCWHPDLQTAGTAWSVPWNGYYVDA